MKSGRKRTALGLPLICALLAGGLLPLSAQEVATGELFSVRAGSVEFLNYEGPHDRIETDAQIRGIGSAMARGESGAYAGKYRITHLPPSGTDTFGADIVEILPGARVDHIDNVRRIISGYVSAKYGYDRSTSDTIALFATYYNAVHRGEMDYFSGIYSAAVLNVLSAEKTGLSTSYREWPGQSQLVIPLSVDGSGAARIAADTVGGDEVVEEIRAKEEERGVDERKGLVELREEQLEEDKALTAEERRQVEEEKAAVEEEKQALRQEKEETEDRQQEVEQALEEAEPGSREEAALKEEAEELEEKEREIAEAERRVEEAERETAAREEEVAAKEEADRERGESIGTERDRIAGDEQETIAREEAAAASTAAAPDGEKARFSFMRVREENGVLLSTLVLYHSATGEELRRSSVNTIRGRRVYPVDAGYALIAGVDEPPKSVRLMILDAERLNVLHESAEKVYGESWVLATEDLIYAVASIDGGWKAAAFRADTLERVAVSDTEVNPDGVLIIASGSVIAEDRGGRLLRLDPETLKPSGN